MSVDKPWLCTICHRSGDEVTLADAELRHRNMLLVAKHNNERMKERHPGWCGPSETCEGRIVMKWVTKRKKVVKVVQGTFLDESGDTWVEMGARMKVSGKVEER